MHGVGTEISRNWKSKDGINFVNRESEHVKAFNPYKEAFNISFENVNPAHPVRLNIARLFFDFQEIVGYTFYTCSSAQAEYNALTRTFLAYDDGLSHLHELPEKLRDEAEKKLELLAESIDDSIR